MLNQGVTTLSRERPYNNLLRRLSPADYALIAPHLVEDEAAPNDLLYRPGDDVQIVHFPCGPALTSYLVANEDGRDVEDRVENGAVHACPEDFPNPVASGL